ncbi:MAG: ATP-binding protein [Nevskia sp.]|jgi:DNA transposition AAA+ family ATPase|nr:ATP-binding protein [Nevskia sp.]MCK9385069.1 ATP-binding protein [Nevskia sp.]
MKSGIVPVKNVARLSAASRALLQRAPGAPGIGLVDGEAGFGKSTATAWLSNQTPSIYVRAIALWTPSAMLSAMCRELRVASGGSCSQMLDRIVETVSRTGQSVFVDEVDYIIKKTTLIETLRDLHDIATVPVIMIGESGIMERIGHLRRFTSRIAEHVTFQPLDEADAGLIADQLCSVKIKPDLLHQILRDTRGNCRNIVVSLARAEQIAKSSGIDEIGCDHVGKRKLFTGGNDAAGQTQPGAR